MIKFYDQVPTIYSNSSRDFQYLSWLINIVLNSVKHNVDDLYDLPDTKADVKITELLASTLGFKIKRNYDQNQLAALVSLMPNILKYKGTKKALILAGNALVRAAGSSADFKVSEKDSAVTIELPNELVDVTLFIDILPYILPAGMTCKITRKSTLEETPTIEVGYSDTLKAHWYPELSIDNENTHEIKSASSLFDISGNKKPVFTNFNSMDLDTEDDFNLGLLNNTSIPTLADGLLDER